MPKRLYKFNKEEIETQKTGTYFNAKNSNKKSYKVYTKEDLIAEIEQLKKRKQYGLVWEDQEEKFDKETVGKLPVLREIKNKEIKKDKDGPVNLLIEGDNYHSLSVLNYTHEKAVDVIYIDPPYNTGSKDFIFNDSYVNKEDAYRHSKWLSFIEKRLKLAKNVLKDRGIIFISINDIEMSQLKLLMDDIFPNGFLANLIWENREGGGSSDSKHFKVKHEYILAYAKDPNKAVIHHEEVPDKEAYTHSDKYEKERGKHKLIKLNSASIQYSKSLDYPITAPDGRKIYPSFGHKKACWRWSKKKLEWGLANRFIKIDKDRKGNWVVYSKQYLKVDNEGNSIERQRPPLGVIPYFSSTMATKQLENIFHKKVFDYSKPYLLIEYLLKLSTRKDSIILDFMAGSGTTGQSVLSLNDKDGGHRQFILCTNNEANNDRGLKIATDICYPRIKKVIEGYKDLKRKQIKGSGGNLKYYKTAFVGATPSDANKKKLTDQSTEMLCIRENTFEKVLERKHFKIFKNNQKHTGILYDQVAIPDFKKVAKTIKGPIHTYIFSLEDEDFSSEFEDMNSRIVVSPIPEVILRVYRRIFGIKI